MEPNAHIYAKQLNFNISSAKCKKADCISLCYSSVLLSGIRVYALIEREREREKKSETQRYLDTETETDKQKKKGREGEKERQRKRVNENETKQEI